MLGARKVNPDVTVQLIVTGDWALPVREAEAANALVDAGCDVIACHIDSPKVVIETAEKRGVKSCGHNANQADLAPKGFITGAELKWETVYKSFAGMIAKGEKLPNMVIGGYDKDMVVSSPFGAGCSEAGTQRRDGRDRRPEGRQADLHRHRQDQHRQGRSPTRIPLFTIPRSSIPTISSRESSGRFDTSNPSRAVSRATAAMPRPVWLRVRTTRTTILT